MHQVVGYEGTYVQEENSKLKTLDTFDNCQSQVFSLGVSQHA